MAWELPGLLLPEVAKQLIGGGILHPDGAVTLDALGQPVHRRLVQSAATVPDPHILQTHRRSRFATGALDPFHPTRGPAQILAQTLAVTLGPKSGDDLRAVRSAPDPDLEGDLGRCHPIAELL